MFTADNAVEKYGEHYCSLAYVATRGLAEAGIGTASECNDRAIRQMSTLLRVPRTEIEAIWRAGYRKVG